MINIYYDIIDHITANVINIYACARFRDFNYNIYLIRRYIYTSQVASLENKKKYNLTSNNKIFQLNTNNPKKQLETREKNKMLRQTLALR